MKRWFLLTVWMCMGLFLYGQDYPQPPYSHEIYFLQKGNHPNLVRLEKNLSKLETRTKLGGLGGSENGYEVEGDHSPVRIQESRTLSFVFSAEDRVSQGSASGSDSIMKAGGVDPAMVSGMMGNLNDPSSMITLYRMQVGAGMRKILLQKTGGALPFGSHKIQSSDKYSFSTKRVKEGYWEFLPDKKLPKGEYAFTLMTMGMGGMGDVIVFAFGID